MVRHQSRTFDLFCGFSLSSLRICLLLSNTFVDERERALDSVDFRIDSHFFGSLFFHSAFLFRLGEEDPVEKLSSHLHVVLVILLSQLVAPHAGQTEHKFFSTSTQNLDGVLTALQTHNCAVVENHPHRLILKGSKFGEAFNAHFFENLI